MVNLNLLLVYLVLWFLWGFLHSLLTFSIVKEILSEYPRLYRIIYNIISVSTLFIVLYYGPSLSSLLYKGSDLPLPLQLAFIVINIVGVLILTLGLLSWNILAFSGFTKDTDPLRTNGIYAFSRHPVYLGAILIFISTLFVEISENSLSWVLGAGGYFVLGTIPEEWKMNKFFEDYYEYSQNVGRFLPFRRKHLRYLLENIN